MPGYNSRKDGKSGNAILVYLVIPFDIVRRVTETTPYYLQGITGYAKAVNVYRERGWEGVLPLPKDQKFPPPKGFTGNKNPMPSDDQLRAWMQAHVSGNVGLRLPKGVIGIDVDSYGSKPGGASIYELITEFGPLPSTWISTSRRRMGDTTSGIRLYRMGEDVKLRSNPKPGIDIIQHHHRYTVVWPSWHPKVDAYYEWWGPDGRESDPPYISELPLLPPEWVEGLRARTPEEQQGIGYDGEPGPGDLKGVQGYGELVRKYIERARQGAGCHDTGRDLGVQLRDNKCPYRDAMETYAEMYYEGTKDFTDRDSYTLLEVLKEFEWAFNNPDDSRKPLPQFRQDEHHAELFPPPGKPMEVAKELVSRWSRSGVPLIVRWREGWYRWTEMNGWTERTSENIRKDVYQILQHAYYEKLNADTGELEQIDWAPNINKVKNAMEALAAVTAISDSIDEPSWLGPRSDPPPNEIVMCRNGLLHVPSRTLLPPDPSFFSQTALSLDFDQHAGEPVEWLKFLNSLWPDDPESINALQEIFGYIISGRTDLQKIMLILGPPRGGKGTIGRILTELVGERNVANPMLMSIGSHFGLQSLIGKSLAIIGDARIEGGKGSKEIVAKLLGISGEDRVSIDRKNSSYWSGRLNARFLIMTNEVPNLQDSAGALASRFVPLYLTRSWLGQEDHGLEGRLRAELSGIMNWSLDGLDRVRANGRITVPATSSGVMEMIQETGSPVSMFIEERCRLDPAAKIKTTELYDAWRFWAGASGFRDRSRNTFGRDLLAAQPSLEKKRVMIDGKLIYHYFGIDLEPRE